MLYLTKKQIKIFFIVLGVFVILAFGSYQKDKHAKADLILNNGMTEEQAENALDTINDVQESGY
ncbi:hypothetical protein [Paraclostridium bifermentans]|uniref:hypothetical protein n=1 Tax=Paraclostridium bifermentans TaxID=1490 RepID=UPI0022E93B17|nr:hypothetical protein [Paraclostridium bifermentans]